MGSTAGVLLGKPQSHQGDRKYYCVNLENDTVKEEKQREARRGSKEQQAVRGEEKEPQPGQEAADHESVIDNVIVDKAESI